MHKPIYHFSPAELEDTLNVLNTAIKNHLCWFDTLHTSMLCDVPFPNDILNEMAHTKCQFGQWYYGNVDDTIKSFEEFSQLEEAHKFMHDNARQLAKICLDNKSIAVSDYQPFLTNQHHLIGLLNKLHDTLLEHQNCFDTLTGAINRRSISLLLDQAFENTRRYDAIYSVAMLDVDYFKKINDTHGHMAGDEVLKHISTLLKNSLRKSDSIGRYGGEEFLILMPETDKTTAFDVIDQSRKDLAKQDIPVEGKNINVSVSVGISQIKKDDESAWQAVRDADFALYRAKESGRNRVEMAKS